jgi:hypothetical protein
MQEAIMFNYVLIPVSYLAKFHTQLESNIDTKYQTHSTKPNHKKSTNQHLQHSKMAGKTSNITNTAAKHANVANNNSKKVDTTPRSRR